MVRPVSRAKGTLATAPVETAWRCARIGEIPTAARRHYGCAGMDAPAWMRRPNRLPPRHDPRAGVMTRRMFNHRIVLYDDQAEDGYLL